MSIQRISTILETELSALSAIAYAGIHPRRRDQVQVPGLLIDLAEMVPSDNPGTEETSITCLWEIRLVMTDQDSPVIQWALVTDILHWLQQFIWVDENIGQPRIKHAEPDHFSPELNGHRVWLIEFYQTLRVGNNVWDAGELPDIHTLELHYSERPHAL